MQTLTNNLGRVWTITITVASIKRVKGLLGINLYKLIDDHFRGLSELLADPIQFVDVIYCLCKEEADARGVSDEDFGWGMAGDALQRAMEAFLTEYVDFFPDAKIRNNLRRVLAEARKVQDAILARMEQELDKFDALTLAKKWSEPSGRQPVSSD